MVPGLILIQKDSSKTFSASSKPGITSQTTATIAKELLNTGSSPTAETIVKSGGNQSNKKSTGKSSPVNNQGTITGDVVRSKDQLLYLAQLLGFQVRS